MGNISLDNLEVGMCLADDVHDRTGRLLLGAGAALTQKHLIIFRTWGVEEVAIEGVDGGDVVGQLPPDVTPDELSAAEDSLAPLFRHAGPGNPVLRELLRLAALRKVQHGYR